MGLANGLLSAMHVEVSRALHEPFVESPSSLIAELELALRVLRHRKRGVPRSIAAERRYLVLPAPLPAESRSTAPASAAMLEYLRTRRADSRLQLERTEILSGGFSRRTIALSLRTEEGPRSIIVRQELTGGLLEGVGLTIADEYPLLDIAHRAGVPTPAPLWLETDPGVLGTAFIVMERVQGRCLGNSLGAQQRLPESVLRSLARMLAALHAIEWRDHQSELVAVPGLSSAANAKRSAQDLLRRWESYRTSGGASVSPLLALAKDWLEANLPGTLSAPCITHGDIGFHNILGEDDRFTALIDWEMACIASPAKDLAHVKSSVEPHVSWEAFLRWYEEAGGVCVDAAEIHWFEVFRAYSMTLVCQVANSKLDDPSTAKLQYLKLAYLAQPVFFDQLTKLIDRPLSRRGSARSEAGTS